MEISKKIYLLRTEYDLTQSEFGKIAGVSDKAVSAWENGTRSPKVQFTRPICEHFGIDLNTFIDENNDTYKADLPSNVIPIPHTYKVPLLGTIACGQPILAVEDAEETMDVPEWVHADFALRCKGDSMINARIFDGDIVYIQRMSNVEPGQIAAVRIDDEATLKRVYYTPGSDRITLRACNPLYPDMIYEGEDLNRMEILGLAVWFCSKVRHEQ